MAIKKKLNKFVVPQEYDQSVIFARGGNLYGVGDYLSIPTTGVNVTGGPDMSKLLTEAPAKLLSSNKGGAASSGLSAAGVLGALPGAMGLMNSTIKDFDTSGIGKEVTGTNDMTRNDILNTNVNVDAQQKGFGAIAGDAASAAMAGMQVAGPWGALAGLVPIATGIFGNQAKEDKAKLAEQQWTNNLQAKNRQFQGQDLRTSMANFSANGGDLFAYGGNMKSQLTSFDSGGSHESNPNSGIMQGTGANGQPNLVEQGETKHDDYIFSDRLKINPEITKQFKLPAGLNGKTFAAASKYLNKEAKERPNDPISNNAIKAQLAKLTAAQEGLKEQMQHQQQQQGIPMQGQQPMQQNPIQTQQLQQPQGQQQEQPQDNTMEDGSQQFKFGGYKPSKSVSADNKMALLMSAVQKMISQGMSQEDIEMQLQKTGISADQADQIVLSAMQQMKGQQQPQSQPQQQGIPMGGQQFAYGGDQTHYQNPTLQGANIGAMGGNIYDGVQNQTSFMNVQDKNRSDVFTNTYDQAPYIQSLPTVLNAFSPTGSAGSKFIQQQNQLGNIVAGQNAYMNSNLQPKSYNNVVNNNSTDFSRYAPVFANIATGISDMFEQPEVVKYGRISPEHNTAHMDYQPIDTEWMNNKMNATYAGTRDQMINNASGNRAIAMTGLSGINQQQQNAIGEAYLKSQDMNYQRRNQATQFNASVEAQNVAAQNQAQQANLQLQMQEMDANARNRAAKRNAARQAILNAASNIGDIGRENWAQKTGAQMTGYSTDNSTGIITYSDGSKYKRDSNGNLIKQQ